MIPWVHVDTAAIPGEPDALRLMRRGNEFSMVVGTTELMNNRLRGSEQALATLTCARLRDRPRASVLIGGLGMGFTLRAALDALGPAARVVVAELVPAVAEWARGPLSHLFGGSLDDPRVELRVEDVHRVIQSGPAAFDAILLDVDNGPEGLTRTANDRLYGLAGLHAARTALRPGGVLAVWSAAESAGFAAPGGKGGWFCHTPMVAIARNVGRKRAMELALTGDVIDAATALDWGLVNRVVPDADLDAAVADLMSRATRGSRASKAWGKQTMHAQLGRPERDAYTTAVEVMAAASQLPGAVEGMSAFLEKRRPVWSD